METREQLAQRLRSIMLSYGEPIQIQQFINATGAKFKEVSTALEYLESRGEAQRGSRGWRAL